MIRLTRFIQSDRLLVVAFGLMIYSFILLMLAPQLGLSTVEAKVEVRGEEVLKSVGYFSAPNWWPVYTLIIPAILVMLVWLHHCLTASIESLNGAHMWFDYKQRACQIVVDEVHASWTHYLSQALRVWFVLALIVLVYSIAECWRESIAPIIHEKIPAEVDWSVATLVKEDVTPAENIVFSIAAWVMQFGGVSLALLLPCVAGALVPFLRAHSDARVARPSMKPDTSDSDVRRGFQRFEELGVVILSAALLAYLAIYFVVLQNVYLRNPASSLAGLLNITKPISFYFFPDISTITMLVLGFILIVGVSFVVPCVMLTRTAVLAKDHWRDYLKSTLPRDSHEASLEWQEGMRVWPFRYLRLNLLVCFLVLGVAGLIVPSVGTYLFVAAVLAVVGWALTMIKRTFKA